MEFSARWQKYPNDIFPQTIKDRLKNLTRKIDNDTGIMIGTNTYVDGK